MDTRAVVNSYYDSVNSGDWETWLTLFADDLIMDEQLAGHVEGASVLNGAVAGLKRGYSKFLMHPQHILITDSEACVIWHCEAANATGVPIDAHGANYFEVHDGKITYMANFHDSVPFLPFTSQRFDS